jgi:hypothetical protein
VIGVLGGSAIQKGMWKKQVLSGTNSKNTIWFQARFVTQGQRLEQNNQTS